VLDRVDRRFSAVLAGDEIARLPSDVVRSLTSRRILVNDVTTSTIPRCVCDEWDPDCVVDVDSSTGEPKGRCRIYGRPVAVTSEQTRRYRFDVAAWAKWLRLKNRLSGAGPTVGDGAMFVGVGTIGGREFGLLVVAPGCERASDVIVPDGSRQDGRALVALLLGDPIEGLDVGATLSRAELGADMGTINQDALERAVCGAPVRPVRVDLTYSMFCRESPAGRRIDDAEYNRLSAPAVRDKFGLFIDVPACAVWRSGRRHEKVLDSSGRPRIKRLGPTSVGLLADYVKRPERPMTAKDTPTYRTSSISPRSATAQLGEVRRSVRGQDFIRPGARSKKYGELPYVFTPSSMRWCVLDRPTA